MNFGLEMTTFIELPPGADNMTLRVELEDFDTLVTFAEYSIFKEADGSAGDSMEFQKKTTIYL